MRRTFVLAAATVAIFAGASEADTVPERLMTDLMADFDLKDFQAAAMVGNLSRETGNFRYIQEINPMVKGSRGGIGYAQWTGVRRDAFESWAEDGADFTDYEVNYGFLKYELEGEYSRIVNRMKKSASIEHAAKVFMDGFLRPHEDHAALDERISYAKAYIAGDFSGAGCQATHNVILDGRMMIVAMCPPEGAVDTGVYTAIEAPDPAQTSIAEIPSSFPTFTSWLDSLGAVPDQDGGVFFPGPGQS